MPKRIAKITGAVLALAVVALTAFLVNLIWFRPWSLNLFYEKAFVEFVVGQPELLSTIGIAERFGYRRHNAHLSDASVEEVRRIHALWRKDLAQLHRYDLSRQSASQRLSTRVLEWFLQDQVDGERFAFHDYPVNQLFGVQNTTPEFMITIHRISDRTGAEHYLSRLGEWGRKFDEVLASVRYREERGIVPPRFVVRRVLDEMRAFRGKPVRENVLYTSFVERLDGVAGLSAAEKAALAARAEAAITDTVYPAYQRLIDHFAGLEPRATTEDGVWKLPDGDAYYAYQLRSATTTRMTPQEVHDLGLREVARIEAAMKTVIAAQGLPGATPADALRTMARDPRFLYPQDDNGRAAALAEYQRILDESLARSRSFFGVLPRARLTVQRIPPFKEATAPGGYYQPPALDGSRPGIFFANLRDMREVPRFGMKTLAYHEGVPGHHLQLTIAEELKGLPTFRRVLPFTAYTEGWALYAEWLAAEMGLYRGDPAGDLGRLRDELFRAVRLVVDTGIHYKRWPREQAIRYMIDETGMAEPAVVSEIERYIVAPGQACAYKVGMAKLQELRARAQRELGSRFTDAGFHDVVLGSGALPLELLEEQVARWIRATRGT